MNSLENKTFKDNLEKTKQLFHLAEKAGLSVNQLALAYMLTLEGMGPVIPGVTSEQLEENARSSHNSQPKLCRFHQSIVDSLSWTVNALQINAVNFTPRKYE